MTVSPIMLAGFVFISSGGLPASESVSLAPDTPVKVGSLEAVCTGIGLDARENPVWSGYPLKVEFAGRGGQYLGDVRVTLFLHGTVLAAISCSGPWVLFRLPAGKYRIDANIDDRIVSSTAIVPATGQSRVILRYPDLGGQIEPAPIPAPSPATSPISQ